MVHEYQTVKAIKVRVYKWKENVINEEFSKHGLIQCTIINETMLIKKVNNDFLEASTNCSVLLLEPLLEDLPFSFDHSYNVWNSLCFSLLTGNSGGLIMPETASSISETIAGYLTSNYHATRDTSLVGERDFRIVVVVNVYMKSIKDESVENDSRTFLWVEKLLYEELMHSDEFSPKRRRIIGRVHDFLLENENKFATFEEFTESDENSLFNLYTSSGDEKMFFFCIMKWLRKEPHRLRANPELDSCYAEVEPAMKIKKFDARCCADGEDDRACAICLEEFKEGDLVMITPCSHMFHCHSIVDWLAKLKMTCPMCRAFCPVKI